MCCFFDLLQDFVPDANTVSVQGGLALVPLLGQLPLARCVVMQLMLLSCAACSHALRQAIRRHPPHLDRQHSSSDLVAWLKHII